MASTAREIQTIDYAIASMRRQAYRQASRMASADLQACVTDYVAACGQPGPHDEAMIQLRIIRAVLARRERAARERHAGS